MTRGEVDAALAAAPHRLGRFGVGGQDHFYLETQIAMAIPGEQGDLLYSGTQHPTEVQHLVARLLGLQQAAVTSRCAAWAAPSAARRPRRRCSPASPPCRPRDRPSVKIRLTATTT